MNNHLITSMNVRCVDVFTRPEQNRIQRSRHTNSAIKDAYLKGQSMWETLMLLLIQTRRGVSAWRQVLDISTKDTRINQNTCHVSIHRLIHKWSHSKTLTNVWLFINREKQTGVYNQEVRGLRLKHIRRFSSAKHKIIFIYVFPSVSFIAFTNRKIIVFVINVYILTHCLNL
jgi:hypothetical protein